MQSSLSHLYQIIVLLLSGDIEINPSPKSSSRECFSICHWNLNSISAQSYTKVSLLIVIHSFDINYVSETFLNSETAPNDPNLGLYLGIICIALIIFPIAKEEVFAFSTKQRFL